MWTILTAAGLAGIAAVLAGLVATKRRGSSGAVSGEPPSYLSVMDRGVCSLTNPCKWFVVHDFVSEEEVARLVEIAEKGMRGTPDEAGPTIMDLNTGYRLGRDGLINIYEGGAGASNPSSLFTAADYEFYSEIVERVKAKVQSLYNLSSLYFTAPTFITRIVGAEGWEPLTMHDEYYHIHADKNNTAHYDYSGLLYLSEYGRDFEGGKFVFYEPQAVLEPTPGTLVSFTAGAENPHQVQRVTSGKRYVLSFWYTCDERHYFENFLDGKAHKKFEQGERNQQVGAA